jgi:hypothetical protein
LTIEVMRGEVAGLNSLGLRMTPAELRDLIALFDADNNGSVSMDEFKAALHVPGLEEDLAPRASHFPPLPDAPPDRPAPTSSGGRTEVAPPGAAGADALDEDWHLHEAPAPAYPVPSSAPTEAPPGGIDQGLAAMPAIPSKSLEQMFAKVQAALCKTTGLTEVWTSKGSNNGRCSLWALDLTLQQVVQELDSCPPLCRHHHAAACPRRALAPLPAPLTL